MKKNRHKIQRYNAITYTCLRLITLFTAVALTTKTKQKTNKKTHSQLYRIYNEMKNLI